MIKRSRWNRFWDWYKTKLAASLIFLLIIHIIQIPHMIWVGDVYMEAGYVSRLNPIADFLLYGVDLVELISLGTIISNIYAHGIHGKFTN